MNNTAPKRSGAGETMNKGYPRGLAWLGRNQDLSIAGIMWMLSILFCGISLHSLGFQQASFWLIVLNNLTVPLALLSFLILLVLLGWLIVTLSPRRTNLKSRRSTALLALACSACANFFFCSGSYFPLMVSAPSAGIEFAGHYYFMILEYDDFSGNYSLYECGVFRLYCEQVDSGPFSKAPVLIVRARENTLYVEDEGGVLSEYHP